MVAPKNNWSNTKQFFNNRRRLTARIIKQNIPVPQQAILTRGRNNRRYATHLNAPRVNKVQLINGIKPSVATISRSPSPSYARNAEKINVSTHRVTANTLKLNKPLKAEFFTVKGRPTLKRNYGRRHLNVNRNNRRNRNTVSIENFVGVINE
jgi:hypothetical protein